MNGACPPHHWYVPREEATEGIVLSKCMRCSSRQYQPSSISTELLLEANKLNKQHHHPVIIVDRRVFAKIRQFNHAPIRESMVV
jgi:hypothetical protein